MHTLVKTAIAESFVSQGSGTYQSCQFSITVFPQSPKQLSQITEHIWTRRSDTSLSKDSIFPQVCIWPCTTQVRGAGESMSPWSHPHSSDHGDLQADILTIPLIGIPPGQTKSAFYISCQDDQSIIVLNDILCKSFFLISSFSFQSFLRSASKSAICTRIIESGKYLTPNRISYK